MKRIADDLIACHRKFHQLIGSTPAVPDEATVLLRCKLIDEEYRELMDAIGRDDLPAIAKEAIDLIYVVAGTLVSYGIDPVPPWSAVHSSNMSKPGTKDEAGKFLKGEHYQAPDIELLLGLQAPLTGESRGLLTPGETAALAELEHHIRTTVQADVIGIALREIRDRDLFRNTHPTFLDYVADVWRYSPRITELFLDCAEPKSSYSVMANRIRRNSITPAPAEKVQP